MPARAEFHIVTGGVWALYYTLPINPIDYEDPDNYAKKEFEGVDGHNTILYAPHDSRLRKMVWNNLSNTTTFNTMVVTLRALQGRADVGILKRSLNRAGDDVGNDPTPIFIVGVSTEFSSNPGSKVNGEEAINDLMFAEVVMNYRLRRVS